ncbi:MAG: ferredoxin family protein [Acidobacteriota bacterium]|nr:ferredoxin family protein [Acidobacteriota bacterium]
MAYVITEKCVGERYATCVEVCPVDCIHPGEYNGEVFMVIHPDNCIDCELCKPACPIDAIVESEDESPEWAAINAELAPDWEDNDAVEMRERDDPPRKPGNEIIHP